MFWGARLALLRRVDPEPHTISLFKRQVAGMPEVVAQETEGY
jgi:hypothetical protein